MILRFSLYGFLKNLRLFEAFLVLALLERGLDFFAIGSLIAVREVAVNLFEIPSGALADGIGRKRCMVVSMAAYVVSYLTLGLADEWWILALAMVAYGIGDAFRSGTHKALIYAWLRQEGRIAERTRIYGYTRSWSKIGSACSALLGGAVLVAGADYRWIFLGSAVPAVLNLVNLATYPSALDRPSVGLTEAGRASWLHLRRGIAAVVGRSALRRLVAGSMAVEGGYAVAKDFLQPLLQVLALALPLGLGLDGQQRTGALVGVISAALFLLASLASRRAHRVESACGGDPDRAARLLTVAMLLGFALLAGFLLAGWAWPAVGIFVALGVTQNLWRPIHVGRFDAEGGEAEGATILSIEGQAKAIATALLAPAIGLLMDLSAGGDHPPSPPALWPVSLLGLPLLGLLCLQGGKRARPPSERG